MVPLIVAGAVAVGSLAAGLYSSYKQGKISEEEYRRKKQITDSLKAKLESPSGEIEPFTFEEYEMTRQFIPEVAQFLEEKSPQTISEAKSQEAQALQRQALQQYSAMSQSGSDVISDAQRAQAEFESGALAKSRRQQVLRDMTQRGLVGSGAGGSGQELLAQMAGTQDAQAQQYQAGLQAAQGAEQRRLSALDKMAGLAGSVRGQNLEVEGLNADIMNSYNQRLASAQNLYNQYAANTRNQGQRFNIGEESRVSGLNTAGRNTTNAANITRQEDANNRVFDINRDNALLTAEMDLGLSANNAANRRQKVANTTSAVTGTLGAGASIYGKARQMPSQPEPEPEDWRPQKQLDLDDTSVRQENASKTRGVYR